MPRFEVSPQVLKEISQSLLEMKKMSRSIENGADAFLPMADEQMTGLLDGIIEHSQSITTLVRTIYNLIAKEAANA